MRYRLVGLPHYCGTLPGLTALWGAGEVRELPDESAAYLLATFPGAIEAVSDVVAPAMSAPPVDRMVRPSRKG
jgi:hypothetical protein